MYNCVICKQDLGLRKTKTCSKICKNALARENTIKQFSDPVAREIQRQKSIEQKKSPEYWEKFTKSIDARTKRWAETIFPRTGKSHSEESKSAIGKANTGRFKGKTWDEIFGKEVADRRRMENSISMSSKNEILLKEKRSSLEEQVLPYLTEYSNNIRIGKYTVDFINPNTKHIIEINGNYWHCNPKMYSPDFIHLHLNMTASQKWDYDKNRKEELERKGYTITTIWEDDIPNFIETLK